MSPRRVSQARRACLRSILIASPIALLALFASPAGADALPPAPVQPEHVDAARDAVAAAADAFADGFEHRGTRLSPDAVVEPSVATGEDAGRTDFWRLLGIFVGPEVFSEDEDGALKLTSSPSPWLNVSLTAAPPVLRDAAKSALDESQEEEALARLDLRDDVTWELAIRLPTKGSKQLTAREFASFMEARLTAEGYGAALQDDVNAILSGERMRALFDRYRSTQNAVIEKRRDGAADTELVAEITAARLAADAFEEAYADALRDAPERLAEKLVTRLTKREFDPLYVAYRNRLQLQAGFTRRVRDPLIGQDEKIGSFSAQWGLPRAPRGAGTDAMLDWIEENRAALDPDDPKIHAFAAELSYVEREPIEDAGLPALSVRGFREIKGSFQWKKKIVTGARSAAELSLIDHAFTATFLRPNEDFVNERLVLNETLTFQISDAISLPVSITWANKSEFVDEDEVRGRIGFSYAFNRLTGKR